MLCWIRIVLFQHYCFPGKTWRGYGTVGKLHISTPLASKDTVSEMRRVLAYPKFKLSSAEQALLLADFLPYAETVVIQKVPDGLPIIRDPADQMFLILAVVGQADALVSGDADILDIKSSFNTPPIMTLSEYKDWLKS